MSALFHLCNEVITVAIYVAVQKSVGTRAILETNQQIGLKLM